MEAEIKLIFEEVGSIERLFTKSPCGDCGSLEYEAACWNSNGHTKCTDCAPGELCTYCGTPGPSCCAACEGKYPKVEE